MYFLCVFFSPCRFLVVEYTRTCTQRGIVLTVNDFSRTTKHSINWGYFLIFIYCKINLLIILCLFQCECTDEMCRETKERVEVCRPHVTRATRNESIVSCRVAEWICHADGVCSTALDYYHHYCRSMFQGRKCSNRCKNSISILRRQVNIRGWCLRTCSFHFILEIDHMYNRYLVKQALLDILILSLVLMYHHLDDLSNGWSPFI